MTINEIQRQAYLEAMGIQPWFPRYVLPGARPSQQCQWPQTASPPAAQADLPPAAPVPAPQAEQLREALREAPRRPRKDEARAPAPVPASPPMDDQEDIRFRLAFIRAGDGLCIVNQVPAAGPDRLSPGHRALLQSLLAACGRGGDALHFEEAIFRWPFVEGDHVAKGGAAARQALSVWLQQQTAHRPIGLLLMMGEAVAPCVTAERRDRLARGRLLEAAGGPWRVLVTRSLDVLLRMPALKREVWRDLRALAGSDG